MVVIVVETITEDVAPTITVDVRVLYTVLITDKVDDTTTVEVEPEVTVLKK